MTESNPTPSSPRTRSQKLWLVAGAFGALGLALVVLAASLTPSPAEAFRFMSGHGRGGYDHAIDEKHLRRGASWILGEVDASDDQIDAVVAIASAAITDLGALREGHEAAHAALEQALISPEVDRDQLEALRQETLVKLDAASARLTQAMADAAEVLTPEQRADLIEVHQEMREHRHGHRHGRWHR